MKKFYSVILLLFIAVFSFQCSKKNADAAKEIKIPVTVKSVQLGDIVKSVNYNGDINADVEVKVFSKVPDRIEKFFVDVGDYVKKGDPIAQINAPTIKNGLQQAEASLMAVKAQEQNLKVEFERAERLYQENAMSKQQYDGVKTQYEALKAQLQQAEAAVNTAKTNYGDTVVEAPISGIIGIRYYEAGDMANMAQPLVTVVQMGKVKIRFDATEEDLGNLALGQTAEVSVKSFPDTTFEGKVSKISPVLDPLTRMAEVEVIINNPEKKLKPGMFARVQVITGVLNNVIVVPRYATVENTTLRRIEGQDQVVKNYYVFVAKDSVVEQRKLGVSYINHVNIAVDSGLTVNENIVVEGVNNLRDQSAIAVVQEGGDL